MQPSEFVDRVVNYHMKNKGLTPGHCDKRFLDVAYRLPLYGIELHTVMVCVCVCVCVCVFNHNAVMPCMLMFHHFIRTTREFPCI